MNATTLALICSWRLAVAACTALGSILPRALLLRRTVRHQRSALSILLRPFLHAWHAQGQPQNVESKGQRGFEVIVNSVNFVKFVLSRLWHGSEFEVALADFQTLNFGIKSGGRDSKLGRSSPRACNPASTFS